MAQVLQTKANESDAVALQCGRHRLQIGGPHATQRSAKPPEQAQHHWASSGGQGGQRYDGPSRQCSVGSTTIEHGNGKRTYFTQARGNGIRTSKRPPHRDNYARDQHDER